MKPLRYNQSASLENPSFIAVGDPHTDWQKLVAELDS
jgi:3'-phosphoadenosine 5'-phosphosulfate (PAPS) 3'-phosphatase